MYGHERSLVQQYKNDDFVFLGVNSDRDRTALKTVVRNEQMTWPSWWDGGSTGGPIARAWQIQGWPTLVIIDRDGVIRYRGHGENLDSALAGVMAGGN